MTERIYCSFATLDACNFFDVVFPIGLLIMFLTFAVAMLEDILK